MSEASQKIAETRAAEAARAARVKLGRNPSQFTLGQRLQIWLASQVGYWAVLGIGSTLRWRVEGWENWEAARQAGKGLIYTFWHSETFSATWFWRKRGIVVMSGWNFDAEYVARIILRHGYGTARGSSSRGALRALAEMAKSMRAGHDTAFTIDGPRGPRHVAKGGAVLLARTTGAPVLCFHIAVAKAYVFRRSWDQTQIPYPFSRAAIFIAPPIFVTKGAGSDEQDRKLQEVQAALDSLRQRGDAWKASR